jgi:hypothetical protein
MEHLNHPLDSRACNHSESSFLERRKEALFIPVAHPCVGHVFGKGKWYFLPRSGESGQETVLLVSISNVTPF